MTVLASNPTTHDNLLPNRFRLQLKRAPNVEFWVQEVDIPGFSIPSAGQPNPFVTIPKSGDHIDYEDLGLSFIVDSQLSNYLEMYTWLKSLGFPDNFTEYAQLLQQPQILDRGVTSEVTVFILNGAQQPTFRFVFHDAFPFALGGLRMAATEEGLNRVVCHCGFKYTTFDVYPVT